MPWGDRGPEQDGPVNSRLSPTTSRTWDVVSTGGFGDTDLGFTIRDALNTLQETSTTRGGLFARLPEFRELLDFVFSPERRAEGRRNPDVRRRRLRELRAFCQMPDVRLGPATP